MSGKNILRRLRVALALSALLWSVAPAAAQTATSGSLSGVVADQQGGVLPGVIVVALHEPTGTRYEAVTDIEGRFQILNVSAGGPYSVTAALASFQDQTVKNVAVALGETRQLAFRMSVGASEQVTVVAEATINGTRAGTAGNVDQQTIETLPTISRSLTDFARTNPFFNQTAREGSDSVISVAGRSSRYNNLQIDGAVNNDLFGVNDSGTPGGATGTQPVSLDAIQEIQLVVAPYDVRQGGFAGGGINAVTRSGSNELAGTAYWFGRNENLVGKGITDTEVGQFKEQQVGFSLGGPIVPSKAFFFSNFDFGRKDTPIGFSADGTSGVDFGHLAEIQRVAAIAKNKYGYDPGGFSEFSRRNNSDKVFVRTDFNIGSKNRLTVRHNYVDGLADVGFPSAFSYLMPDAFYQIGDKTNSTVGQLNTTLGRAFNELRIGYQRIRTRRGTQPGQEPFPSIQVDLSGGTNVRLGTEASSHRNELDQDIIEITDDFTLLKGNHTFTVGTHNELFHFRNLFIQNNFGAYRFASIDRFEQGISGSYAHSFSNTSNPLEAPDFGVLQLGFYVGDQWRVRPNLTLTYGIRADIPSFPDVPNANPAAVANFGYRTDIVPEPMMWAPRLGFNWDVTGSTQTRSQVRGGIGYFAGRTPYVWLSNQYGNTGIDFTRLSLTYNVNNSVAFVADPNNQPKSIGGAGTNEIDMVDPDYQFPSLVRGNLAYDRELGFWGLTSVAEILFSKTVNDVKYQNLNYIPTGTRPDGRLLFSKKVATLSDAILLGNTSEGDQFNASIKVERPFRGGLYFGGSYIFGRSRTITDGTNSTALSTWGNTLIGFDPNNAALATSNFEVPHRVTFSASQDIPLGKGFRGVASIYYNGQTGRPYSTVFNNTDANGDGRTFNDIIYVPKAEGEVIITNGTWALLDDYIRNDAGLEPYRGQIAPRNSSRGPWTNSLDFRFAANMPPVGRARVELTFDIFNLINLFNSEKGIVQYTTLNDIPAVLFGGIDPATGKEIYNLATISSPTFNKFIRDDLRSRWQAQWGLRVRF